MLQPTQPMGVPNTAATGPQAPKPQGQMPAGSLMGMMPRGGIMAPIDKVADAYRNNPQALEQKVGTDLLAALADQRLKAEKAMALQRMQLEASGQQPQENKTVVEQNQDELLDLTKQEMQLEQAAKLKQQQQNAQQNMQMFAKQMATAPAGSGIAGLTAPNAAEPQAMAAGGIVAFDDGGKVTLNGEEYEVDPVTGKVKYKGVWTDPKLIQQSAQSPWNMATRQPGVDQEYKPSTQEFLAGLDKDFAAAKQQQTDTRNAALEGKEGYDWKGQFYPVEGGKVMINGIPTDPRVLQGATKRVFSTPPTQPAAPTAIPTGAPLTAPGGEPSRSVGAQPGTQPTAPRQGTVPGVEPQRPVGIATVAPNNVMANNAAAINKNLQLDPAAAAAAEREAALKFLGHSAEDEAKRRQGIASLEELDKARFDPQAMHMERIRRTLAGGAGKSFLSNVGAGMTQAASDVADEQYRQERSALAQRNKAFEDLLKESKEIKGKAYEGGTHAMQEAGMGQRAGIQAATQIQNEQLRQAVESSKAAAMHTANTLRSEEMSIARAQTAYINTRDKMNDDVLNIQKQYGKEIEALSIMPATPENKKLLETKRKDLEIAVAEIKEGWRPALEKTAQRAGIEIPGKKPKGTDSGTVDTALVNKLTNTR